MEFDISEHLCGEKVFGENLFFTRPQFYFHVNENLYWQFKYLSVRIVSIIKFRAIYKMSLLALKDAIRDERQIVMRKIAEIIDSKIYRKYTTRKFFMDAVLGRWLGNKNFLPNIEFADFLYNTYHCEKVRVHPSNFYHPLIKYIAEDDESMEQFIYLSLIKGKDMNKISRKFALHHPTKNIFAITQQMLNDIDFRTKYDFDYVCTEVKHWDKLCKYGFRI